jgi:hypothetical protein
MVSGMGYPMPQLAQLPEEQLPHAEDADDEVIWDSPPGPADLDTNPHLDISRDRSWPAHTGQAGVSLPSTRTSNSFRQALQWYSYIGMDTPH